MIPSVSTQTYTLEKLSRRSSELNSAADLLADAFMFGNLDPDNPDGKGLPDPFYNRLNRGDEKVRRLFRSIIGVASKKGHTIVVARDSQSGQILGASWIKERGVRDLNILDFPKLIVPAFRAFGLIGAIRYGLDVMKHIPVYPTRVTYLSMLGVNRSSQGQGIGKALVQYAKDHADDQGVMLSTMNPKNIKIYERLGFSLLPEKEKASSDSKQRPGFSTFHMVYQPPCEYGSSS